MSILKFICTQVEITCLKHLKNIYICTNKEQIHYHYLLNKNIISERNQTIGKYIDAN
jgi:hypothetical protein